MFALRISPFSVAWDGILPRYTRNIAVLVNFCLSPISHVLPFAVGAARVVALLILLGWAIPLRGLPLFIKLPNSISTQWSESQGSNGYHQDWDLSLIHI